MEKVECKACSATIDKSIEFCSSCGEWLGLSIKDIENSDAKTEPEVTRRVRPPEELLSQPLSNYGATSLPTRNEVPGIRAVFFLAIIIPLIAAASYYYNQNIAEEVIEEIQVVEQSTTSSTSTSTTTTIPISVNNISDAQKQLTTLGLYSGDINNELNNETKAAIMEFQRLAGLSVDGILGPKTKAALEKGEDSYVDIGGVDVNDVGVIIYSKEIENAHSAISDARATLEVLKVQTKKYSELENNIMFLSEFSKANKFAVDYAGRIISNQNKEAIIMCKNFSKSQPGFV